MVRVPLLYLLQEKKNCATCIFSSRSFHFCTHAFEVASFELFRQPGFGWGLETITKRKERKRSLTYVCCIDSVLNNVKYVSIKKIRLAQKPIEMRKVWTTHDSKVS